MGFTLTLVDCEASFCALASLDFCSASSFCFKSRSFSPVVGATIEVVGAGIRVTFFLAFSASSLAILSFRSSPGVSPFGTAEFVKDVFVDNLAGGEALLLLGADAGAVDTDLNCGTLSVLGDSGTGSLSSSN